MRLSGPLFILLMSLLCSFQTQAEAPLFDEAGRDTKSGLYFQTSYFEAQSNYSREGGEYNSLAAGSKYNLLTFDFGLLLKDSRGKKYYASSQVANATSEALGVTRTYSSLTQATLGIEIPIFSRKSIELAPDFSVTFPFERIDTTDDTALNREGAVQGTARLVARGQLGVFNPFGFAGVTYRDEGRSHLMPYGLGAELQFSTWALGGELRGYQSLTKDQYTDERQKREVVAGKNGGALRFFAIEPSLLESHVWLNKKIGRSWNFKLGAGATITGANTAGGWSAFAGIQYFFGSARKAYEDYPANPEPQQFQEEINDGVDQSLFQPEPPPRPKPIPRKKTPQQRKKQLQEELDQTEFQIELKREKDRRK